jgi:hypothetical protein
MEAAAIWGFFFGCFGVGFSLDNGYGEREFGLRGFTEGVGLCTVCKQYCYVQRVLEIGSKDGNG